MPWRERRLAGPQLAAEHDQVARAQLGGEGLAERAHRLGVRDVEQEGAQRSAQLDVRGVAPDLPEARGAPRTRWSRAAPRGRPRSGRRSPPTASTAASISAGGDAVALAAGLTPNRRRYMVRADRVEDQGADRLRRRGARAARRACESRSASVSTVVGQRRGRRVEQRPRLEGRAHHARPPRPTPGRPYGSRGSPGGGPRGGGGDQLVQLGVDLVVPLEDHHVAGAVALQQPRAGDPLRAACASGRWR